MRKSLIAVAVIAATIFGVGYLIGQLRGVPSSSAASLSPNQTPYLVTSGWHDLHSGGDMSSTGPHVDGSVTAIGGDTITIKPDTGRSGNNENEGVTTVLLTGTTQYSAGPTGTATKSSITVGAFIIAQGTVSSDGKSISATQVNVMPSGGMGGGMHVFASGPRADGTVTAVGGNSITIKPDTNRPGGQDTATTVVVNSSTQYFAGPKDSGTSATLSSIRAGSFISATGTLSSDGKTLTATRVLVLPSAPTSGWMHSGRLQFGGPFGQGDSPFRHGNTPFSRINWQPGTQPGIHA